MRDLSLSTFGHMLLRVGPPINEGHSITVGIIASLPTVRNPSASLGNSLPPRGFNNLLLPVGVPPPTLGSGK